jgi:glutathione reductase (NADPH)
MNEFDVDLFVIGAGSGGVRAARVAGVYGARVMIAEDDRIGGTCVIRGCVPKKLFVYASRYAEDFADAAGFGWDVGESKFDWARLRDNVQNEVSRLSGLYRKGLEGAKAAVVQARAAVGSPHDVHLATGNVVTAKHILIATGGRPSLEPAIPGGELAITSNDVFHLATLPKRMIVVGGGYIALEFASVFARFGVKVTLVHRGDNVLRGFDEDLRGRLRDALAHAGIDLKLKRTIDAIEQLDDGARRARLSDGSAIDADVVLVATGRRPNTMGLGLHEVGVALDGLGAVRVNEQSQSSVPSIYAVGDVTNRVNLTPVAIREGHAVADLLFGERPWTVDHDIIPTAVFTTPEIGVVGLSEGADVCEADFRPMRATLSGRQERVYMKLVVARDTQKMLGVHVLGHDAAEIIQSVAIAVKMGATKRDFDATMALHPSAAEELVTMRAPRGR